jgi:hypothetical protein
MTNSRAGCPGRVQYRSEYFDIAYSLQIMRHAATRVSLRTGLAFFQYVVLRVRTKFHGCTFREPTRALCWNSRAGTVITVSHDHSTHDPPSDVMRTTLGSNSHRVAGGFRFRLAIEVLRPSTVVFRDRVLLRGRATKVGLNSWAHRHERRTPGLFDCRQDKLGPRACLFDLSLPNYLS